MTAEKFLNDAPVIKVVTLAASLGTGLTVAQILAAIRRGTP